MASQLQHQFLGVGMLYKAISVFAVLMSCFGLAEIENSKQPSHEINEPRHSARTPIPIGFEIDLKLLPEQKNLSVEKIKDALETVAGLNAAYKANAIQHQQASHIVLGPRNDLTIATNPLGQLSNLFGNASVDSNRIDPRAVGLVLRDSCPSTHVPLISIAPVDVRAIVEPAKRVPNPEWNLRTNPSAPIFIDEKPAVWGTKKFAGGNLCVNLKKLSVLLNGNEKDIRSCVDDFVDFSTAFVIGYPHKTEKGNYVKRHTALFPEDRKKLDEALEKFFKNGN